MRGRQSNCECGAHCWPAFDGHNGVVRLDDFLDQTQTEAAATNLFGFGSRTAVERLEDILDFALGNALTSIGDLDLDHFRVAFLISNTGYANRAALAAVFRGIANPVLEDPP